MASPLRPFDPRRQWLKRPGNLRVDVMGSGQLGPAPMAQEYGRHPVVRLRHDWRHAAVLYTCWPEPKPWAKNGEQFIARDAEAARCYNGGQSDPGSVRIQPTEYSPPTDTFRTTEHVSHCRCSNCRCYCNSRHLCIRRLRGQTARRGNDDPGTGGDADKIVENLKKSAKAIDGMKAREEALHEELKQDQKPIFDLAQQSVKDGLAEHAGDESANNSTITVDPSTLKTFGPNKWTIQGHLKRKDKDGNQLETTWEVELQILFVSCR